MGLGITMAAIPKMGSPEALASMLVRELAQRNITFGLDNEAILNIMRERTIDEEVMIAAGKPPRKGRDASVEVLLEPPTFEASTGADGRLDYKNLQNIAEVKAGDVIARGSVADAGEPGINIFGKEVRPPALKERIRFPAGKNTVISGDGLEMQAAKDGFLRWNGERIDVAEIYLLRGDVDLRSGNIRYNGDVEIFGNVQPGFEVNGGGDVRIMGNIDAGSVTSQNGKVIVRGGVAGTSDRLASIVAEGDIQIGRARFAHLESRSGKIVANFAVEHSEITAAGDLILRAGPAMSCTVEVGGKVDVTNVSGDGDEMVESDSAAENSRGNRRKFVRVHAAPETAVQVLQEGVTGGFEGALHVLSAGGAKVRVPNRLREGSRYQLQFKLPNVDGTMWMDAEVIRRCEEEAQPQPQPQGQAGGTYAFRYVNIEPAVREALAKYCMAEDLRQHRLTGAADAKR